MNNLDSPFLPTGAAFPMESCIHADPDGAPRLPDLRSQRMKAAEPRKRQPTSDELSVVVQLVEAACKARDGDHEATRVHIAHAVALMGRKPGQGPSGGQTRANTETQITRGGLPAWQTRKIFAYVEANLSRRIPIRELARLVDLSASHFCRAFKCTFGVSPRDYVLRQRIEVAQGLMLMTTEALSSIAVSCGMCDQSHFTRSFHRIVGETPYTWRRTRRGALRLA